MIVCTCLGHVGWLLVGGLCGTCGGGVVAWFLVCLVNVSCVRLL